MSESTNKAVFLSYAREDTDAARRIADALRGFGVEVWFDQAELRGGDAWDQKIRRQIKDCALFVPIISAHSEERGEGYFRLEWKLADERTHLMAKGVPFLVPVVVDDTSETEATVPDSFRAVQWTRLPGGVPTPDFVALIKRLMEAPRKSAAGKKTEPAGPPPSPTPAGKSGLPLWVTGLMGAVVVGLIAFIAFRPPAKDAIPVKPAAASSPSAPTKAPVPVPSDKSLAVLPFTNLSDDKDANSFFSEGIHEDILTSLSNIRALRLVSRTSVLQYRGTTKSMRQIGQELGVAYILEGSVRKAGNRVRVTGQLIRAGTDEHVWAKNYDRDMTDIFAIQAELAQAIAAELNAALSPEEKNLLERPPTQNVAAYELALKAREIRKREEGATWQDQEQLLRAALKLDPNYAAAYADLTYAYGWASLVGGVGLDPDNARKAKTAIDRAVQLAPESPDVIRGLGDYYYYIERDYGRAMVQFDKLSRLRPNDTEMLNRIGSIQRRQGRWAESIATWRRLEQLDPTDLRNTRDLMVSLTYVRRFEEAAVQGRKVVGQRSDLQARFELAFLSYLASGATEPMEQLLARLAPAERDSPAGLSGRKQWAIRHGDLEEAIRLDRGSAPGSGDAFGMAMILIAHGDLEAAKTRLGPLAARYQARVAANPTDAGSWAALGMVEAIQGGKESAVKAARKACELLPESRDFLLGGRYRIQLAWILAWTGDKEAAIAEIALGLKAGWAGSFHSTGGSPTATTVHEMKRDPHWAPLRGDPRFEALLNDPKNNAPLY